MNANSIHLLHLTVIDSPRRSWLLRFWIVGCLLAASFCVFKGLEASSSARPTTRQITVTKEVRKQTRMDEIKEGDVVLARDEFGETVAPQKVTRVFRRSSDHLRLLTFESRDGTRQTIKTTDEHPFALADSLDFVAAKDLTLGTEVPGPKGERQTLIASLREEHPDGIPVFNFEVEGFHTYFVSDSASDVSLLVHNQCTQTWDTSANARILRRNLGDLIDVGEEAHHIVASTHPRAEDARRLLRRYNIDVNSANNGVGLPNGLHHGNGLHSRDGIERVTKRLKKAVANGTTYAERKQNILDALAEMGEQMSLGNF